MRFALMTVGGLALLAAWRLVATGRASVWPVMTATNGALGAAALAIGHVHASGTKGLGVALGIGVGAGVALYLGTVAFVLIVRRWPVFDRHVREIYDQRKGLSLGLALLLGAGITAAGEELFWRGLFQPRLALAAGSVGSAVATWACYVTVNAAGSNLPILAGGVVGGAVWGALALWTHGVVASLLCHVGWTALMLAVPPGGSRRVAG